jgi:hypothetical protein
MGAGQLRLTGLTREESLRLLGSVSLARIVFTQHAMPAIRPVNHALDGGDIIIRSHSGAAVVTADIGPGAGGNGTGHGQHRRAEHDDLGHRPDDVARDHEPAGQEAEVRVNRAAHPLERRAAVRAPQVQPPVRISNDKHRQRGQD